MHINETTNNIPKSDLDPDLKKHWQDSGTDISRDIQKVYDNCDRIGEFSDVWRCRRISSNNEVAIKVLRGLCCDDATREAFVEQILELAALWQTMNYPSILECHGVSRGIGCLPGFVLPFCDHGNISQYLKRVPSANKLHMLIQVAGAIDYLHSKNIVHGDIRSSNILIDEDGTPKLADLGLSRITSQYNFTTISTGGACRWMAPEVLLAEDADPSITECSDIYSFGMTILEVFTGRIPYSHIRHDTVVIFAVARGDRPERRESGIPDAIWEVLQHCWQTIPHKRPSAAVVEQWLRAVCSVNKFETDIRS